MFKSFLGHQMCGVVAAGSSSGLYPEGRWFESSPRTQLLWVVSLVSRTMVSKTIDWGAIP